MSFCQMCHFFCKNMSDEIQAISLKYILTVNIIKILFVIYFVVYFGTICAIKEKSPPNCNSWTLIDFISKNDLKSKDEVVFL